MKNIDMLRAGATIAALSLIPSVSTESVVSRAELNTESIMQPIGAVACHMPAIERDTVTYQTYDYLKTAGEKPIEVGLGIGDLGEEVETSALVETVNSKIESTGYTFASNIDTLNGEKRDDADYALRSFLSFVDKMPRELLDAIRVDTIQITFDGLEGERSMSVGGDTVFGIYIGQDATRHSHGAEYLLTDHIISQFEKDCPLDPKNRNLVIDEFMDLLTLNPADVTDLWARTNFDETEQQDRYTEAATRGVMTPAQAARRIRTDSDTYSLESRSLPTITALVDMLNHSKPGLGDRTSDYLSGLLAQLVDQDNIADEAIYLALEAKSTVLDRMLSRYEVGYKKSVDDPRAAQIDGLYLNNAIEQHRLDYPELDVIVGGLDDNKYVRLHFDEVNRQILTMTTRGSSFREEGMPDYDLLNFDNRGMDEFLRALKIVAGDSGAEITGMHQEYRIAEEEHNNTYPDGIFIAVADVPNWAGWDLLEAQKKVWDKI